jgi:hypothetical protein
MNHEFGRIHIQPAPLEPFVEADEAAPFLRMSAEYLKKLARAGKIPAHPRGDGQRRRWLFLMYELAEWMRSRVNSACDPCSNGRIN